MSNLLKRLMVTSVDLCRRGANPRAHIRLAKQRPDDDNPSLTLLSATRDSLLSILGDDSLSETQKLAKIEISSQELARAIDALPNTDDPSTDDQSGDNGSPAVAKADSELARLRKQLELSHFAEIARKYAPIFADVDSLANRLLELSQLGTGAYEDFVSLLDDLLQTERAGALFKELGSSRRSDGTPIENAVRRVMLEHPELSRADAIVMAYRNDRSLPETVR